MQRFGRLLVLFSVAVPVFAMAGSTIWPALPKTGFVSGRPATKDDIALRNAVFVAEAGGISIGKPIAITIPQYAYFNDCGKKVPVIIVQAEEARGQKIVGARRASGEELMGTLPEFDLLGTQTPK